jgi:hypothetical protein
VKGIDLSKSDKIGNVKGPSKERPKAILPEAKCSLSTRLDLRLDLY